MEEMQPPVEEQTVELKKRLPKGIVELDNGNYRDLRAKNHYDKQVKLYSLCGCNSGKKHKWCCNGKQMVVIDTGTA